MYYIFLFYYIVDFWVVYHNNAIQKYYDTKYILHVKRYKNTLYRRVSLWNTKSHKIYADYFLGNSYYEMRLYWRVAETLLKLNSLFIGVTTLKYKFIGLVPSIVLSNGTNLEFIVIFDEKENDGELPPPGIKRGVL